VVDFTCNSNVREDRRIACFLPDEEVQHSVCDGTRKLASLAHSSVQRLLTLSFVYWWLIRGDIYELRLKSRIVDDRDHFQRSQQLMEPVPESKNFNIAANGLE
jgi:hypothetical protein